MIIKKVKFHGKLMKSNNKKLISERKVENLFKNDIEDKYSNICFLCSEFASKQCHRRILAEYLKSILNDIEVIHL